MVVFFAVLMARSVEQSGKMWQSKLSRVSSATGNMLKMRPTSCEKFCGSFAKLRIP